MQIIVATRGQAPTISVNADRPVFTCLARAGEAEDERRLATAANAGRRYDWVHSVTT